MIMFWIAASLLAGAAGAIVLQRASKAAAEGAAVDPTVGVYRRALGEIDDLARRGLIAGDEQRAGRAEAGRRLLAAVDTERCPIGRTLPRFALVAAVAAAPIGGLILYLLLGSSGAADQPFAGRLAGWRAHPEAASPPELAAALRAMAAERPADPEPQRRLALLDLQLGDPDGAVHALRKALAIAPGQPELLAPLGEIMVLKAQGKVAPDALAIFDAVLRRDPTSPVARYYAARGLIQAGETGRGLAIWQGLLHDLPAGDPRRGLLDRDMAAVLRTGSPAPPVPDTAVPTDMSAAIRGMVAGLAARLKRHPDEPQGWIRLVRAYTVLGEAEQRDAALDQARRLYAARPDILAQLTAAKAPSR